MDPRRAIVRAQTALLALVMLVAGAQAKCPPKEMGPNGHLLVLVPAGKYVLGEKGHPLNPLHSVKLRAFRIADAETTWSQFAAFVEATGYRTDAERTGSGKVFHPGLADWVWQDVKGASWRMPFGPDGPKPRDDQPVTQISGADATAYCEWLQGRLPTCDEWEAAARAGAKGRWPWGPKFLPGKANIWNGRTHAAEAVADGFTYAAPVRSYAPNAWGLYDVIGNVFEYCSDLPEPLRGREKTLVAGRGGSWWCSSGTCSFFNLVDIGRMDRHGSLPNQGFRIVFETPAPSAAPARK